MNMDTCNLTKWNKKFYNIYKRYNDLISNYEIVYLDDAYKNPSIDKRTVWHQIMAMRNELNGYNLTILGATCHSFSCAFCTDDKWYYFTKDYTRVFDKLDI